MNVYKPKNQQFWRFAIVLSIGASRTQHVVNTYMTDQRAATEVMRKTQLLAEYTEAQMPLPAELRKWLERANPKVLKRLAKLGLIGNADAAAIDGIEQHVEDYVQDCMTQGHGAAFASIKRSQLRRMLKHTGARRLTDVTVDRVASYLADLKTQGLSHRTRNQHRTTVIAWLNWCVCRERLDQHRIDTIPVLNEDLDRRRERRAATDEEVEALLAVMPERRRLVFLAAVFTGLRRGEMNAIERRDIDLSDRTLRVRPEVGKTAKAAVVPIHDALVEPLREHLAGMKPNDLVFKPVPQTKTLRRDLAKAGINYRDEHGRQLDFHAMRTTFATRLLRSGIHPSIARRFTRHGSIATLERHYDKLGLDDAKRDIDKLPGFKAAG
ncbi:MAG: site-specific integrase [Planctomycetota bacterium]